MFKKTNLNNLEEFELDQLADILFSSANDEFSHKIVDVKKFIYSPYYLNMKGQIWDNVANDIIDFYNSGHREFIDYETIGGGKSFKSSVIAIYEAYKLLCLKNPQKYYGLANDSMLTVMNMSLSGKQAKNVVFDELWNRVNNSYFFKTFYPPNPDKVSVIEFKQKNVCIISGNSKETTPLGYALIVGIMDEVAFYYDDDNHEVAEGIYNAITRRIFSRFGENGKVVLISQANYKDDFMQRHIAKMKELGGAFIIQGKTIWQARPELFKLGFIDVENFKIPIELEKEYHKNPEKFKRDFMAISSDTIEPYIKMFEMVNESCLGLTNPIKNGMLDIELLRSRVDYRSRYIHIDLALKKDACGFAMTHKRNGKVFVDLAIRITKEPEIDFSEVREKVIQLRDLGYKIKTVTYDGWQSIDSRQILTKYGFNVDILSVDRTIVPYETLKQLFYDKKITLPDRKDETVGFLLWEIKNLEKYQNKKIDHSPKSSKDVADAVCGASYNAVLDAEDMDTNEFNEFAKSYKSKQSSPDTIGEVTTVSDMLKELDYE